jgi:hypothetical protein
MVCGESTFFTRAEAAGARGFHGEHKMRPTYYELIQLNPLLQSKRPEDVEELMDAIEECGYVWQPNQKLFFNPEISRSVRTQGLDMFTPKTFKEGHNSIYEEYRSDPEQYDREKNAMLLWSTWMPRLVVLFLLDLVIGWLFLPTNYWLISLGAIIAIVIYLFKSMQNSMTGRPN